VAARALGNAARYCENGFVLASKWHGVFAFPIDLEVVAKFFNLGSFGKFLFLMQRCDGVEEAKAFGEMPIRAHVAASAV
jgi:hypothetical protein